MKSTLYLLVVALATAQAIFPKFLEYKEVCMQEIGITEDEIPHPPPGEAPPPPPPGPRPEPSRKLKCFLNCLAEKAGIINAAGELQTDKIAIPGVNLDSCKSITNDDQCERAWLMERCVKKLMPRPN